MSMNSISGELIAVGEGVDPGVVGETVMALLSGGGYAEYATVHIRHTLPVPSGLTIQATVARWPCFRLKLRALKAACSSLAKLRATPPHLQPMLSFLLQIRVKQYLFCK
jgi:NADPH:quinone reductase-like Zn-dependent oxidoreductase